MKDNIIQKVALTACFALAGQLGCGDSMSDSEMAMDYPGEPTSSARQDPDDSEGGAGMDSAGPNSEEPFIPEEEDDFRLQPPAASRTFVFVANTDLNSVARIDSITLQITTLDVGLEPTLVRTNTMGDTAVVLNEGSDDVSIIYADRDDLVVQVDVTPGANELLLSPNGDYAIAFYDDKQAELGDDPGSLSDATLVRLHDATAYNLVVGLHIREVEFDDAGQRAFFVTDDGVAIVEMDTVSADLFVPPIRVTLDVVSEAGAVDREVEVTADGDYGLVRVSTQSVLRLVNLETGKIDELDLGAIPTDLDLLPDGDEVVTVLRRTSTITEEPSSSEVVIIPLPDGFSDSDTLRHYNLGEEVIGLAQYIPQSRQMALYSTLNENDHLTLLDLDSGISNTFALRKGIECVNVSPDGRRLLVMHTKLPGEPIAGTPEYLGQSYAYTVFNLDNDSARLIITETLPGDFVFANDDTNVFILLSDVSRDVRAVEWTNLVSGRDTTVPLRRFPQSIGVIPATNRIYVAQEHEVGRMAFIDTETGEVREVTGYHLNSRTE